MTGSRRNNKHKSASRKLPSHQRASRAQSRLDQAKRTEKQNAQFEQGRQALESRLCHAEDLMCRPCSSAEYDRCFCDEIVSPCSSDGSDGFPTPPDSGSDETLVTMESGSGSAGTGYLNGALSDYFEGLESNGGQSRGYGTDHGRRNMTETGTGHSANTQPDHPDSNAERYSRHQVLDQAPWWAVSSPAEDSSSSARTDDSAASLLPRARRANGVRDIEASRNRFDQFLTLVEQRAGPEELARMDPEILEERFERAYGSMSE